MSIQNKHIKLSENKQKKSETLKMSRTSKFNALFTKILSDIESKLLEKKTKNTWKCRHTPNWTWWNWAEILTPQTPWNPRMSQNWLKKVNNLPEYQLVLQSQSPFSHKGGGSHQTEISKKLWSLSPFLYLGRGSSMRPKISQSNWCSMRCYFTCQTSTEPRA